MKPKRKRTTSLPNVDKRRYGDLYANYVRQEIENLTAVDQLDEFDLDEDTSVSESDNSNPRFLEFPWKAGKIEHYFGRRIFFLFSISFWILIVSFISNRQIIVLFLFFLTREKSNHKTLFLIINFI